MVMLGARRLFRRGALEPGRPEGFGMKWAIKGPSLGDSPALSWRKRGRECLASSPRAGPKPTHPHQLGSSPRAAAQS